MTNNLLNTKLTAAMASVSPEHTKYFGGVRCVSLVALAGTYSSILRSRPNSDVAKLTGGGFTKLLDYLESEGSPFFVRRGEDGNDWVSASPIPGVRATGSRVGCTTPNEQVLIRKVKTAFNSFQSHPEWLPLPVLSGEYRKLYSVAINDDVEFHTKGRFCRFVDWAGASRLFMLHLDGTEYRVSLRDEESPKGKSSFVPEEEFLTKKTRATSLGGSSYFGNSMPRDTFSSQRGQIQPENVFRGRKVYISTEVLLFPVFWRKVSELGLDFCDVRIIAPVVYKLTEHAENFQGGELADSAKKALEFIAAARKNGCWKCVSSTFTNGISAYPEPHFVHLAKTAKEPICILTANNKLISQVDLARRDDCNDFVSLVFFDMKRGILKKQHKIETDDLF